MKRRLIACILAFTMLVGPGADLVPAAGRVSIYAEEAVIGTEAEEMAAAGGAAQTENTVSDAGGASPAENSVSATDGSVQTENTESAAPESGQTGNTESAAPGSGQTDTAVAVLQKPLQTEGAGEETAADQTNDNAPLEAGGTDQSETTGQTDTGIPNAEEPSLTEGSGSNTDTEQTEEAAPAGEESAQTEQSKGSEADPELTDPKESPAEGGQADTAESAEGEGTEQTPEAEEETGDTQNGIDSGKLMLAAAPKAVGNTVVPLASGSADGSSALRGPAGSGEGDDSEKSLLQEMIENALKEVSGTLTEKITVTLKKNTIYTGNVDITENLLNGQTPGSGFALELAAEDAGEDGLQADGSILFTGVMTIRSIPVIIKGMGLQGAVSVQNAKLNYYGTAADDDVNITAMGSAAKVEIATGDGADNVDVEVMNSADIAVNTGDGSDKVRASVTDDGKSRIYTKAGDDTVTLRQGEGEVIVDTGDDDDTISVTDLGGTGTLDIKAGRGDDSVSLKGQDDSAGSISADARREEIQMDLGDGMDEAAVDLSVAAFVKKIAVKDAGGRDRLYLTGELDTAVNENERITGTAANMTLKGTQGELIITSADIESFTDDLMNKRTKKVYFADLVQQEEGSPDYKYLITDAFTNYVYCAAGTDITGVQELKGKRLFLEKAAGADPILTSFILDARAAGDSDGETLVFGATDPADTQTGTTDILSDIPGVQVVLRGKTVEIGRSNIRADLIRVEAYSGTLEKENMPKIELLGTDIPVDVLNISDQARVSIGSEANLSSYGDIIVQAKTEQVSGTITLYPGLNLIELKLAKAVVDISGKLEAGLAKPGEQKGAGSVHILAATNTTAGIAKDGTPYSDKLPFAITMASTDAIINLSNATITAADSIRLNTRNRLEVSTRSDSTNGLPVAIAVSVLTTDSKIHIEESRLTAGKDVIVSAAGDLDAVTIADRGEGQKGVTGGYLSTAVALQHVKAEIGKNTIISAGGDVVVKSSARERTDTRAEATSEEPGSGDDGAITDIYNELRDLWNTVKALFNGNTEDSEAVKELDDAVGKISVSGHSVRVDEASKISGDVKVDSVKESDGTVTVNVTVSPYRGYTVGSITCLGLIPGETTYTVGKYNSETKTWSFPAGTKDITVFVTYEGNGAGEESEETEEDPNVFEDKDSELTTVNINEIVDKVTGSVDDVSDDADVTDASAAKVNLTLVKGSDGAILTYETVPDPGDSGKRMSLEKVAPGQELRLVVNPDAGYLLKEGSLKATYTIKENDKLVQKTVVVNPDSSGRYFVTIPENVVVSEGVRIEAEFVRADNQEVGPGNRGFQMAGSIALTVATNDNRAVIDQNAKVTAGSDTTVSAVGTTDVSTLADGTAITGTGSNNSDATVPTDGATYTEIEMNEVVLDHGSIVPVYPKADRGKKIYVKINPDDNYRIKQGSLKAVIKATDGSYTEEVYMARQSDFLYTFIMPNIEANPEDVVVTFTGEFENGKSGEGTSTNLGAALAITIAQSHNRADIKGQVESKNIRAEAFGDDSVRTDAMAGYSSGETGIGGALSVQVASVDSKARIYQGAQLKMDGKLAVEAEEHALFFVDADASGSKRQAKGLGAGIGIAVGVNGADAVAAVQDGVTLTGKGTGGSIESIRIRADQTVKDSVMAAAGAASGKTSLAAVGAADIIGTSATSYLGKVSSSWLTVTKDVEISASNIAGHTVDAEGAAAGKGTGMGAAIGGSIVTDVAKATLAQDLNAGRLDIASVTESSVENVATASASGGRVPFRLKFTDSLKSKLLMAVADLAVLTGSFYINEDQLHTILQYRLRVLTTEGTLGLSAAAAANVQKSRSISEIKDDVNVHVGGRMSVTSENRTEALAKANGSTVDSGTGIGVGGALNFVDIENIARVGTGTVHAGSLNVSAITREKSPEYTGRPINNKDKADVESFIKETVGDYVSDLIQEIGLGDLLTNENGIAKDLLDDIVDDAVKEITDSGELFDFIGDIDIGKWIDTVLNEPKMHSIGDKIAIPVLAVVGIFVKIPDTELDKYRDNFVDTFKETYMQYLKDEVTGMVGGILESTFEFALIYHDKDRFVNEVKKETKRMSKDIFKRALNKAVKKSLKTLKWTTDDILDDVLDELDPSGNLAENVDLDDIVGLFSSSGGSSGQSTAGKTTKDDINNLDYSFSDAIDEIADDLSGELSESICSGEKLDAAAQELEDKNITDAASKAIIDAAEENNIILTDEQLAILLDPTDLLLENRRESYGNHRIDTQAISGAGARGTGIAGSAAVTKLNAVTRAEIADKKTTTEKTDKDGKKTKETIVTPGGAVTVEGEMRVFADEKRLVNNVASAALNAKGSAAANFAAGEEADMDVGESDDVESVAEGKYVTMTVGFGGTAEIEKGEITKDRPKIWITLKTGFALETNAAGESFATVTYKDRSETIRVRKQGEQLYIDTADLNGLEDVDSDTEFAITLNPVEVLHNVPAPTPHVQEVDAKDGDVIVEVKNRELDDQGKLSARAGDVVTLTVKKAKGRKVETISFTWKDADGKTHTARINPSIATKRDEDVFSMVTTNPDEFVYSFRMPDGEIKNIDVYFVKGNEADASQSPYSTFRLSTDGFVQNGLGRGIGMGASFAMITGSSSVEAVIGRREGEVNSNITGVKAGSLTVGAISEHEETIASVAGTDPLSSASSAGDASRLSIDASGAVNMLDNSIKAEMAKDNKTEIIAYKDSDGKTLTDGSLSVTALEDSESNVSASAFNVGKKTAVGATAAVNMAVSDISAALGTVDVSGGISIAADSHSRDYTSAVASAVGQEVEWLREKTGYNLDDNTVTPEKGKNKDNATASSVNGRLTQNKQEDGEEADNALPLSMNVLRSQPVTDESPEENTSAWDEIQDDLGKVMTGVAFAKEAYNLYKEDKYRVAAAVGLTWASHAAKVSVDGSVHAGDAIRLTAGNDGNFATLGTAASASIMLRGNSIAGGVAIAQSHNKAGVDVKGDLISDNSGDITVKSTLTQNLDKDFIDRLTAQSLSAALSGPLSTASVGGAVSFVQSKADSTVKIEGGTDNNNKRNIKGGNITIEATDKSRLNARAGGVSLSIGSSFGVGAAASGIWSENTVSAKVGDYTNIVGSSLTLNAEKQAVTGDDYKNVLAIRDKENNDDLISVKESKDKKDNNAKVNLYATKVLKAYEHVNKYSFQNQYVEAISGSANASWGKAAIAGSVAVILSKNKVNTQLGEKATVSLTKDSGKDGADGHMTVSALDDATTRVIGGSLSASASLVSLGITAAVMINKDTAAAEIGKGLNVIKNIKTKVEAGDVLLKADVKGKTQVFTGAASVAALGKTSSNAASVTLNVIKIDSDAHTTLGSDSVISSGGKVSVTSGTELDLTSIGVNASESIAGFSGSGLAAGGTLSLTLDKAAAKTEIGANTKIQSSNDATIASDVSDQMISGAASQAAAFSTSAAIGAALNVVKSGSSAKTLLGENTNVKSTGGSVNVTADSEAWMLNATAALPGSIGTAMGGSFNVNLFEREAAVEIEGGQSEIHAAVDTRIRSSAKDHSVMAGLMMAGSVTGQAVTGNLVIQREKNKVRTVIGKVGSETKVEANRSALVESYFSDDTKAVAGSIALANMGAAVGLTDVTLDKQNEVTTSLGKSRITGRATESSPKTKNMKGEEVRGVYIGANAKEKQLLAGAGGSLAGSAGVTAVSANIKSSNKVYADASGATLWTKGLNGGIGSDVSVIGSNETDLKLFAGGVNFGLAAGIGAAAVVVTSDNDVKALVKNVEADGAIDIRASNKEDLLAMNINAGGSPDVAVEIGVTVTDQHSRANALTAGKLYSEKAINLKAENTTDMTNIAAALGIAGKVAAIPVFVYNGFTGEANAMMGAGKISARNGVNVSADSRKTIDQYTVGAAFTGKGPAAVSGAVTVTTAKDKTNALVTKGADILLYDGDLLIKADSDYTQTGVTGSVGASGTVAATVNGMVNLLRSSTLAEMEGKAKTYTTYGNAKTSVKASAKRDVTNIAANVAGGGTAGVGVTVMILDAGDKIDEDAAHQLTYGSSSDGTRKAFNSTDLMDHLKSKGVDTSSMETLPDDLKGNGQKLDTSDLEMNGKPKFDASSGYNSQSTSDDDDGKTLETGDLVNARKYGSTAYKDNPLDSVTARIGGNADISFKNVEVLAEQETLADLYGATVGAGGTVGGGVSFSMARLRSNVSAASLGKLNASNVTVNATSKSGEITPEAGSDEENRMKGIKNKLSGLNPSKRSIRSIGLVVSGAGTASFAMAGGGVRLDNVTQATLGGTVTGADSVTVNSDALYKDILAATLAVSAGGVASVAGSVALAIADGTVSSTLDTTANISGSKADVHVTTNSVINVDSVAAAASFGGTAGVIAGMSMATNGLTQNTVVARGAKINSENGTGSLNVHADSKTKADALLMGVSAGFVGVGMGLGIAKVKPNLNTTVGVDGGKDTDVIKYTTLTNLKDVNITNTVTSTARADMLTGTVGAASVAGNVLLVYNDTDALAKAANVTGSVLGDFNINGKLAATGTSEVSAVAIGGVSVGVTVNHVDVNAKNRAELNTDNFALSIGGTLSVTTGNRPVKDASTGKIEDRAWDTKAIAKTIAGNVGAVVIGVNTAVARNRSLNDAVITGSSLNVNKVLLGSYGTGAAEALLTGLNEGALNIATSVVYALNETQDRAYMDLKGAMNGDLTAETDVRGKTKADMLTGSGALIGNVTTNVATARGLTGGLTDVRIGAPSETAGRSFTVSSKGYNDITSTIDNLTNCGAVTVGTMVGRAFSKDVYDAKLSLKGGKYALDKVSVTTDYTANTVSDVTPSSSGVSVSLVGVAVNKAAAKNTVYAGASLALEKATLETDNNIDVLINGNAKADAEVHPADFSVDLAVGVGVNKANAVLSGTQAAMLLLGEGGIEKAKDVKIKSFVNQADALAVVGGNGSSNKDSVKISAVSVDTNNAKAEENMANTAAILGGAIRTRIDEVLVDHGYYYRTYEDHFDYSLVHDGEYLDRDENGKPVPYGRKDVWVVYKRDRDKNWHDDDDYYWPFGSRYFGGFVNKSDAKDTVERLNKEAGYEKWTLGQYATDDGRTVCGYKIGEHYDWVTEEVLKWEPELVLVEVPTEYVDLTGVDVTKNILKAENLEVYAGTAAGKKTSATARTDGAKSYGLVTVGSLDAKSSTSESYNAVFAGVTATITNNVRLKAHGNTNAESVGYVPGGWGVAGGTTTESKAGVGSESSSQNVAVIIGEKSSLTAGSIDVIAQNEGMAKSSVNGKTSYKLLANVNKSRQQTQSFYNTLITVGKNAKVESTSGDVRLLSVDTPQAESKLQSSSVGFAMNYNTAKGENEVHQMNNVDFVNGAQVTAKKNVVVQAYQTTRANAETKYDGKGGVFSGNTAKAENTIDRIVRINVDKNVKLTATNGFMKLLSFSGVVNEAKDQTSGIDLSGKQDKIQTTAYVESDGFIALGNAKAYADVASTSEITVASEANLKSKKYMALKAMSTSNSGTYKLYGTDMDTEYYTSAPGVITNAQVKSEAGIPLPNAVAKSNFNYNTFVNINKGAEPKIEYVRYGSSTSFLTTRVKNKTTLTSEEGELRVRASNDRLSVQTIADSLGKGAAGAANGTAWIEATLTNAVWIDVADLTGKAGIDITADTGGMPRGDKGHMKDWEKNAASLIKEDRRPVFEAIGKVKLKGIGKAKANVRITGTQINQIRTNDKYNVGFKSDGYVTHVASDPTVAVKLVVKANASVPKIGFIKLGKTVKKKKTEWYYFDRCDFCDYGQEYDVDPTDQETPEERYKEAWEEAMRPINDVQGEADKYHKTLVPIGDINRSENGADSIVRARYGEEEYLAAGKIFVLALQSILKKDIRLDAQQIMPYRLWTNNETFHTVYLLPNATQLYVGAGGRPQFIADILKGDAFGDGQSRYIALYSALTDYAYKKPVIPIGSTGSLDFITGTLTIPSFADVELYLHEVSSAWFIEQLEARRFRMLQGDRETLNDCALNGGRLPDGEIREGLTMEEEKDGWTMYWLGDTPETAANADQTLVYLLINEETDEVDAFRTSVNMLRSGEEPVDVSLYIFRDADADMTEEEKYNMIFFDTPEGEMSLVKLFTNTADGREMIMPRGLQIILRKFPVKGIDMPVYSFSDCLLVLTDRHDGKISALDDWYKASYDNDTFNSPYTLIKGISGGDLAVTIKKDQPVWPEWTGEDTAETIDGTKFVLIDGVWYGEDEAPLQQIAA